MVVAKTRKGKAHENRTKEGPRTGVRTSGRTNSTPGEPNLHRAGPGGEKTHEKRGQRAGVSVSLSSLRVFWVSMPSCLEDAFSFIF